MNEQRLPPRVPSWGPEDPTVRLFVRWFKLRKISLATRVEMVPRLLQEGSKLWTFDNPQDPWGSRTLISIDALTALVERAEAALVPRKPIVPDLELEAKAAV